MDGQRPSRVQWLKKIRNGTGTGTVRTVRYGHGAHPYSTAILKCVTTLERSLLPNRTTKRRQNVSEMLILQPRDPVPSFSMSSMSVTTSLVLPPARPREELPVATIFGLVNELVNFPTCPSFALLRHEFRTSNCLARPSADVSRYHMNSALDCAWNARLGIHLQLDHSSDRDRIPRLPTGSILCSILVQARASGEYVALDRGWYRSSV